MTKVGIIARKIRKFFVKFSAAIMDVDSSACFYVIILEKKRAMRLPHPPKRYLLRRSDLKIPQKNWIFSKYDIINTWL